MAEEEEYNAFFTRLEVRPCMMSVFRLSNKGRRSRVNYDVVSSVSLVGPGVFVYKSFSLFVGQFEEMKKS